MKKTLTEIRLKAAEPLNKKTFPVFPKLGVPDDRRSVVEVNTPRQTEIAQRAISNAGKTPYSFRAVAGSNSVSKPDLAFTLGNKARSDLSSALMSVMGFVTPPSMTAPSAPQSTSLHERTHAVIGRAIKNPLRRERFAGNLVGAVRRHLPPEISNSWEDFHSSRYNTDHPAYNEEKVAGLMNYLNNPLERQEFYQHRKMAPQQAQIHHQHMNEVHRALQRVAPHVDLSWATHIPIETPDSIAAIKGKYGKIKKMAIKDIASGTDNDDGSYDYGHLLPEKWAKNLTLTVHPGEDWIVAHLYDSEGNKIGHVNGLKGEDKNVPYIEPHSELHEDYTGQGLGKAMYEALYTHAYNNGIREVQGGGHSEDAHRVHSSLAQKHNLSYRAAPRKTGIGLVHGPYKYSLDEPQMKKNQTPPLENVPELDTLVTAMEPFGDKIVEMMKGKLGGDNRQVAHTLLAEPDLHISSVPYKLRADFAGWVVLNRIKRQHGNVGSATWNWFSRSRPEYIKAAAKLYDQSTGAKLAINHILHEGTAGAVTAAIDAHPNPQLALGLALRNEKGLPDAVIHKAVTSGLQLTGLHPEDLKSYLSNQKFVPDSNAALEVVKKLSAAGHIPKETVSKVLATKTFPSSLALEHGKANVMQGREAHLHPDMTSEDLDSLVTHAQPEGTSTERLKALRETTLKQLAMHPNTPKHVLLSMLEAPEGQFDPNTIDWNDFDTNTSITNTRWKNPMKAIRDQAEQMKSQGQPDAEVAQFIQDGVTKVYARGTRYSYSDSPEEKELIRHLGNMNSPTAPKTARGLLNRLKVAESLTDTMYQKERKSHAESVERDWDNNQIHPDHFVERKIQEDALANKNIDRETALRIIDSRKQSGKDPLVAGGFTNPNLNPQDIRDRSHYNPKEAELQLKMLDPDSYNASIGYERLKVPDVSTEKLRQLRDKIESMGGSVHQRLLPGITPAVKALLDNKGHLTSAKMQEAIDAMPATDFWVGHGKGVIPKNLRSDRADGEGLWHGPQRHSHEPSRVFHVNYTNEHVKKLKESGAWPTFAKIQRLIAGPNPYQRDEERHPLGITSIGWVRHTGDNDGLHLEEAQSDITQNRLPQELARGGFHTPDGHLEAIRNVFVGGRKTGQDVLAETFLHHLRQDPANHGKPLHWPTMDIKSEQADPPLDTYSRLPKELGFAEGGKYGQIKTQSNPMFKDKETLTSKITKSEDDMIDSMLAYLQ